MADSRSALMFWRWWVPSGAVAGASPFGRAAESHLSAVVAARGAGRASQALLVLPPWQRAGPSRRGGREGG
ncbi:hypothetical protein [Brachybacterium sacelli]|uniref:hypothetical protein n=1 Tax=Brachybacterium sacelli TaxID=173364 RepID=UPI00361453A4